MSETALLVTYFGLSICLVIGVYVAYGLLRDHLYVLSAYRRALQLSASGQVVFIWHALAMGLATANFVYVCLVVALSGNNPLAPMFFVSKMVMNLGLVVLGLSVCCLAYCYRSDTLAYAIRKWTRRITWAIGIVLLATGIMWAWRDRSLHIIGTIIMGKSDSLLNISMLIGLTCTCYSYISLVAFPEQPAEHTAEQTVSA